jgi:hypothetical protein
MNAIVQKQIASQRTDAKFPYLIRITHHEYPDMLYANASEAITYAGDVYAAASFTIDPPNHDGAKTGDATLTISAVDQVWIQKIRATQIPAKLQFKAVIVYEDGAVTGIEPLEENEFTLRNVSWNELTLQFSLVFDERMAVIVTSAKCNAQLTPGCA